MAQCYMTVTLSLTLIAEGEGEGRRLSKMQCMKMEHPGRGYACLALKVP